MNNYRKAGPWTRRIAKLTIVAAVLVLIAGPLIKFGLPWKAGLGTFAISAIIAGIGGIICLIALLRRRGGTLPVLAAAAGLAAFAIPAAIIAEGRTKPPIHDLTTDTANAPQFIAITPELRGKDSNTIVYDPALAAKQAKAYPTLRPLVVADAPDAAFTEALAAARARGWAIVATRAPTRIEATDTVPWWGFKDDIVVRLTPEGAGTRIDVRSTSRVGVGDLGVNAKRISDYLAKIRG
jgi:uncharacterized protein (DUF1499 family)